jgi:hypothetical protein
VVKENQEVAIIFKPMNPNGKATADEVVIADVIKIDVQRDLELLRPRSLPNRTVRPLQISSQDIEVGADVRAIGHPKGEDWTYTKGIVSSVRPDYEWLAHRATVIQTQTPINPGNSGGPLLISGFLVSKTGLTCAVTEQASISQITSGTITITDTGEQITLNPSAILRLIDVRGRVTDLRLGSQGVRVKFEGTANSITLGNGDFARNLKPTFLEWLFHQQKLGLF